MAAAVAMAAPTAASASVSLAHGGRLRSTSSSTSSSAALSCSSSSFVFGTSSRGFPVARRTACAAPAVRIAGVRCSQGNYIPGEHKFLYEGVEKLGSDIWNRTYYPKADDHRNVEKLWYIVDAADKRLGRLATAVAVHIRGKNLPTFTPSVDMGAYVVVINAEKVGVTGKKPMQKMYMRHSGRPGGLKKENFQTLQKRIPERIVEHAVRGMLPKGRLGRRLFTHLKVYTGPEHPHTAQQPLPLPITDKRINMS